MPALLPVALREFRELTRRASTFYNRTLAAAAALTIVFLILEAVLGGMLSPNAAGETLFQILSALLFVYLTFAGGALAADSISKEKREGTLPLLMLTFLSPVEIVLSKLASSGAGPLFNFVAVLPAPSLSFFLGGMSPSDYGRMVLALLNALFVALNCGLLASACSHGQRRALAAAILLIAGFCFVLPAGAVYIISRVGTHASATALLAPILLASPAMPVLCILFPPDPNEAGPLFVGSLAGSHLLGWILLLLAGRFALRSAQDQPLFPLPFKFKRPRVSNAKERSAFPLFCGGALLLMPCWLLAQAAGLLKFGLLPLLAASAFFLHWCLKLDLAIYSARSLGEQRDSGELEILLSTPLEPVEIIRARMLKLKERFFWPFVLLLLYDLAAGFIAAAQPGAVSGGLPLYAGGLFILGLFATLQLADMYTLSWCGLWTGFRTGDPGRALRQSVTAVVLLPVLLLGALAALAGTVLGWNAVRSGAGASLLAASWIIAVALTSIALCARAINNLRDDFREMAAGRSSGP